MISGATEIYGIMGHPVAHSLSPAMHNSAFAALGLNKVYVAFDVIAVDRTLEGFRALGIKGASVTVPHKQAVIAHLDSIDPVAKKIGAVNTLVIKGEKIHGLNTDWIGANRAIGEHLDLKRKSVLLLGAGGSARAIGFGLLEAGTHLTLANRTVEKGAALADAFECRAISLAEAENFSADVLINATSVGMKPHTDKSPLPAAALHNFQVVMDIVYAPLETKLLKDAAQAGCTTIDGLAMLLYQGAAQFELWTGHKAPVDIMRRALLGGLQQST
jgi:shikimate dehydrogenase